MAADRSAGCRCLVPGCGDAGAEVLSSTRSGAGSEPGAAIPVPHQSPCPTGSRDSGLPASGAGSWVCSSSSQGVLMHLGLHLYSNCSPKAMGNGMRPGFCMLRHGHRESFAFKSCQEESWHTGMWESISLTTIASLNNLSH